MSRGSEGEKALLSVSVENQDTGSGFIATLMTLEDGRVLVASTVDPSVGLYKDRAAWEAPEGWPEHMWRDLPAAFEALLRESFSDHCNTCDGIGLHEESCPDVRIVPTMKARGFLLG